MILVTAYLYLSGELLAFWYLEREEPPSPRLQNLLWSFFWPTWPLIHLLVEFLHRNKND